MTDAANPTAEPRLGLDHLAIMVPDLEPGLAWYQERLGARLIDRWDNPETGMEWAHLQIGNFVLELVKMPSFNTSPGRLYGFHHLGLKVADCDAAVARLAAAGAEVMRPPSDFDRHAIRWAFVKDCYGNTLEIISDLARAA